MELQAAGSGASDRRRFSRHAVRHVLYRRRYGIGSLGLCDADGGEARGAPGEPARAQPVREKEPVDEARARAIALAATHQLVTKYTGLVAIDRTPPR